MVFLVINIITIYLASLVDDNITLDYFFKYYLTSFLFSININPDINV